MPFAVPESSRMSANGCEPYIVTLSYETRYVIISVTLSVLLSAYLFSIEKTTCANVNTYEYTWTLRLPTVYSLVRVLYTVQYTLYRTRDGTCSHLWKMAAVPQSGARPAARGVDEQRVAPLADAENAAPAQRQRDLQELVSVEKRRGREHLYPA